MIHAQTMAERGERALPLVFVSTSEPSGSKIDGRDLVSSGELLCTLWPCEEAGMRSQTR